MLTVIVPNYNHAHYLPGALDAILNQSYRPLEVLVIDDASTDHSVAVLERYARRHAAMRVITNQRNCGVNVNYNRALELASGDYVVGCASDDLVLPGFFERSLSLLIEYPEAALCSTLTRVMTEDGRDTGVMPAVHVTRRPGYVSPDQVRSLLSRYGTWIQGNTAIYRRDLLRSEGGLLAALQSYSDGFVAQVLALKHGACFIPEPLCVWRRSERTYSARTSADPDRFEAITRVALELMRTKYAGLFPSRYDQQWQRERRFFRTRVAHEAAWARFTTGAPGPAPSLLRVLRAVDLLVQLARYRPPHTIRRAMRRALRIDRTQR